MEQFLLDCLDTHWQVLSDKKIFQGYSLLFKNTLNNSTEQFICLEANSCSAVQEICFRSKDRRRNVVFM
jgi:hypothetical protein